MDSIDSFLERNEELVEINEQELGEEGSVEQVEKDLKELDFLLKQMEHFENGYHKLKSTVLVRHLIYCIYRVFSNSWYKLRQFI